MVYRNVNHKHEDIILWQIIINIVSLFRNLCLERVVRFIDHQDKCEFDSSTAEDILQDGRLKNVVKYIGINCRIIF